MEVPNESADNYIDEESAKRRNLLFKKYIQPNLNLVFKLCIEYSHHKEDIEDNFNEVLVNFYRYIETYDPSRTLQTWLHIVTKRFVNDLNYRNIRFLRDWDVDVSTLQSTISVDEGPSENFMDITNYKEMYSDTVLEALEQLKPIYREALLLQQAGYKLNEIVDISYLNGNLRTKNIETIKSRLFLAKQQMRKLLGNGQE